MAGPEKWADWIHELITITSLQHSDSNQGPWLAKDAELMQLLQSSYQYIQYILAPRLCPGSEPSKWIRSRAVYHCTSAWQKTWLSPGLEQLQSLSCKISGDCSETTQSKPQSILHLYRDTIVSARTVTFQWQTFKAAMLWRPLLQWVKNILL